MAQKAGLWSKFVQKYLSTFAHEFVAHFFFMLCVVLHYVANNVWFLQTLSSLHTNLRERLWEAYNSTLCNILKGAAHTHTCASVCKKTNTATHCNTLQHTLQHTATHTVRNSNTRTYMSECLREDLLLLQQHHLLLQLLLHLGVWHDKHAVRETRAKSLGGVEHSIPAKTAASHTFLFVNMTHSNVWHNLTLTSVNSAAVAPDIGQRAPTHTLYLSKNTLTQ